MLVGKRYDADERVTEPRRAKVEQVAIPPKRNRQQRASIQRVSAWVPISSSGTP